MAGEIFISYRRADEAWARLLHDQLQAQGVVSWYDAHVGAGQDWRTATAKALEDSKIFVLLYSSTAAQSSDIAKELAAATLEKKLIIPVRLENIAPKGAFLYELASRNWIDAFENTEAILAELAKNLSQLLKTGVPDDGFLPFVRTSKPTKRKFKPFLITATVVAFVFVGTVAVWQLWPQRKWMVESSRSFISSLALEEYPAFSPNGATLAYTSDMQDGLRQIYVRNLAGGEGVRITNDTYDDISPTWSSDGARLAYVAIRKGEPCRIMVTTVPSGNSREAGRCRTAETTPLSWQSGTSFVYAVERSGLKGSSLFRLNLDTGDRHVIVAKTALRDIISSFSCSPDGKWLAYVLRGEQIMVRDLSNGREKELVRAVARGDWRMSLAWTDDSQTVLAGISSDVGGSEITAYPLRSGPSYNLYTTPMKIGNFATGGGLLALEADNSRSGLARASASPKVEPDIIDPASGRTWSPTFAPDGTMAFLSNRSGTNAIWLLSAGREPTILLDGGLSALYQVRFSPDGSKLALVTETPANDVIKIMTRAGATLSGFTMPSLGLGLPNWTPDGKAVLIFDRLSLRTEMVPIDDPERRKPFAPPHWVGITPRADGTFATRADKPGVWRIDTDIKQISTIYPAFYQPPLAFRGDDVLVPDYSSGPVPRILAQPISGGPGREVAYAPGAANRGRDFQSDFAVNPVTNDIVYTAQISRDTNIDLLKLGHN